MRNMYIFANSKDDLHQLLGIVQYGVVRLRKVLLRNVEIFVRMDG